MCVFVGSAGMQKRVTGSRKGEGKKYLTPCLTSFGIIPGVGQNRSGIEWSDQREMKEREWWWVGGLETYNG